MNNEKFHQYIFSLWLRFFTNKIFPEYKGEIHFESDCYVLNDKCIREFILHLKKQGIAARRAFHHGIHSINYDIQDELQNRYFRNYKRAGTGMFLKEYIKEKGLKYIQSGNLYQDYLLYNIPDNPIPTLTHENALCYPNSLNLSYAVHLRSPSGFRNRVDYVSTRKITQPLTQEEYQRHKQISQAQSSRGANLRLIDIPDDYDQRISINFCVYPWEYTIDEEIQKQAEKL